MTLEELKIVISVQTDGLRKEMDQVKKQLGGLQNETNKTTSGMKNIFKKLVDGISALGIGKKLGEAILGGIKEAMNVEAAVQQIKRIMGESSNQFLKWSDTQAAAFNMSKSEALKYGSVFGNLLMTFTKNGSETMKYTEDLLKASSIIASATGRSMEDVMERVRSGLLGNTEAIEDLGVNVNVAMIQSTEAFKKFANGKSWDQLDFQTQQQIRLMAILEQTNKKYGDSVSQNTSTQLAQLVAQLKNVQLSLGQAFLPILQIVLPVLNQFASGLAYVMNIVAQFSQALFGKSIGNSQVQGTQAQAKAMTNLGNATEKAGKQAKGALAGFDEINLLNQGSDSGGIGSVLPSVNMPAGPMPLNFETNATEIGAKIQEMTDNVKSVLGVIFEPFQKSWDLYGPTVMNNFSTIFSDIKEICTDVGNTLYSIWTNPAVQESVILLNGIFSDLFTIFTRIFDELVKPAVKNFLDLLNPDLNPTMQTFLDKVRDVLTGVKDFTDYLAGDGFKYVKDFLDLFIAFKAVEFVVQMGAATAAVIADAAAWGANTLALASNIIARAKDFVLAAANAVKSIWTSIAALIEEAIVMDGATVAQYAWNLAMSLNPLAKIVLGLTAVVGAIVWAYNTFDWFREGVNGILNAIIYGLNCLIDGINGIHFTVPDWVPVVGGSTFEPHLRHIEYFAKGGIVDQPTLAMVGEAGKEAVMPLENNTGWITELADKINARGGNGSYGPMTVILRVGKTELARVVAEGINDLTRQNGELILDI